MARRYRGPQSCISNMRDARSWNIVSLFIPVHRYCRLRPAPDAKIHKIFPHFILINIYQLLTEPIVSRTFIPYS